MRSMSQCSEPHDCLECGCEMQRDYHSERANVGDREYHRPIVSDTLAINPEQIPEHRRKFPDVKVLPDGRPVFDSFRKHEDYLKKSGVVKHPQRIRRRAKRVKTTSKDK